MPKKNILTLTFIFNQQKILLGFKKRGFGLGRYNGFGGKVETNETIEETAAREVFEETGLAVNNLEKIGVIDFLWPHENLSREVHIFRTEKFQGNLEESEEMKPQWFTIDKIPYKKMWVDDQYWLPLVLNKQKFIAKFTFDAKDNILAKDIKIVDK